MTAWIDKLNDAWAELATTTPVARQYRTKLVSTNVSLNILAGMRAIDNAPCLILQTALNPAAHFELGGMRLQSVPEEAGPLLVLSLEDGSRRDLFLTICSDVVSAAALAVKTEALDQFLARLEAWRQFLRDRHSGLSRSDTIGLIGELLVLDQLLEIDPALISAWASPNDGLHDFTIKGHALEVKSSVGPASAFTISKLDQLDTTGLRKLDLLHVRMIEAPDGQSLRDIIRTTADKLPSEASRRAFDNALLRRGVMPDDIAVQPVLRIQLREIKAYSVSDSFPRLTRATLPNAIKEVTYTLEIRAISTFSVDTAAVFNTFVQRDQS